MDDEEELTGTLTITVALSGSVAVEAALDGEVAILPSPEPAPAEPASKPA